MSSPHRPFYLLAMRATLPSFVALLLCFSLDGQQPSPGDTPTPAPAAPPGVGVGDLLVAPVRIILEGRERTAEVSLINTGTETATYRISFIQLRMVENGTLQEIDAAGEGERFSSELIRYSPRQVTLEPRVAQTVRLQVRKPADLAEGEYRSHLLFRAVPPAAAPSAELEPTEGFRIQLIPIFGVSVPVIVRHGATSTEVSIDSPAFRSSHGDQPPAVTFRLLRQGTRSVYGNIRVTYVPAKGGPQVVGISNGIAVYTPLSSRLAEVPLNVPEGVALQSGGRLRISYTNAEQNGEGQVLASAEIVVP